MADVLVVGEALVDLVVTRESTTARPGGSPANVAVGLGRLGQRVRLLTALGDDDHGRLLRRHLTDSRIEVLTAPIDRTSTAVASIGDDGSASYAFDITWDLQTLDPSLTADWLHVGSLATVLTPGADAVLELTQRLRWAGARVSFDPNCRPGLTPRDLRRVEELVALSTVTKLSDEDLSWLCPDETAAQVAARWLSTGPELVVVTRGQAGALAFTSSATLEVPAAEGGPVVDTVGAGDAFMAGLLDGLLQELPLAATLHQAATVARRTCERPGADPPWS